MESETIWNIEKLLIGYYHLVILGLTLAMFLRSQSYYCDSIAQ